MHDQQNGPAETTTTRQLIRESVRETLDFGADADGPWWSDPDLVDRDTELRQAHADSQNAIAVIEQRARMIDGIGDHLRARAGSADTLDGMTDAEFEARLQEKNIGLRDAEQQRASRRQRQEQWRRNEERQAASNAERQARLEQQRAGERQHAEFRVHERIAAYDLEITARAIGIPAASSARVVARVMDEHGPRWVRLGNTYRGNTLPRSGNPGTPEPGQFDTKSQAWRADFDQREALLKAAARLRVTVKPSIRR